MMEYKRIKYVNKFDKVYEDTFANGANMHILAKKLHKIPNADKIELVKANKGSDLLIEDAIRSNYKGGDR